LKSAQINAQLEDFVNTTEASTSALSTLITNVNPDLVTTSPSAPGTLAKADDLLLTFLEQNSQFTEVSVVDSTGTTLAASHTFTGAFVLRISGVCYPGLEVTQLSLPGLTVPDFNCVSGTYNRDIMFDAGIAQDRL
jgi:hypothetical protein